MRIPFSIAGGFMKASTKTCCIVKLPGSDQTFFNPQTPSSSVFSQILLRKLLIYFFLLKLDSDDALAP